MLVVGDSRFAATAWTKLGIEFRFPFNGSVSTFRNWAQSDEGIRKIVDRVAYIQGLIIGHIKWQEPYVESLRGLRQFGPAEWPYLEVRNASTLLFRRLSPSLHSDIASCPLDLDVDGLRTGKEVNANARMILRACDLVDCGYPTEALLIAIAVLDAAVQDSLIAGMEALGLQNDSTEALLRNTTQARLSTYLDPVLMLVTGHSMRVDDASLFQSVSRINRLRNDAIHNGKEVSRSEARDAVKTVYDTLQYLSAVGTTQFVLPPRPSFVAW